MADVTDGPAREAARGALLNQVVDDLARTMRYVPRSFTLRDEFIAIIHTAFAEPLEVYRDALSDMVHQFAYDNDRGQIHTGGLSALEAAFDVLGWDDPHPLAEELLCVAEGCRRRATCGRPSSDGYKWECSEHHFAAIDAARKGEEVEGGS